MATLTSPGGAKPGVAQPVPLWRQLQAAAAVVQSVQGGESGTASLARVEAALRPGAQALAFHALRNLGRAQALRHQLARRAPPPAVDALLCTALALAWQDVGAPYEAFTLVDQAVEAAKRNPATRGQAAFVNACLRRFLRERQTLVDATQQGEVAVWNHPSWWIAQVRKDHPQHWREILRSNNAAAPLVLRVNVRQGARDAYLAELAASGIEASAVGDQGVVLARARPVHDLPGFTSGRASVQDAAAQLAAPLLLSELPRDQPLRVLDACAAPGGKTAHLLELSGAQVVALDIDAARCERIGENLQRLGLQARIVAADAGDPASWWDGEPFDGILLDAPCTASGIVRRHPDVRWLRRASDVPRLAEVQARLLEALWPLLKPGGRLLYCTCSVFRAEGEGQMQTFVAHHKDAFLRPAPGHLIPHDGANDDAVPDNLKGDHDGFYYSLLGKRGHSGDAPPPA